jgi:hypothetical protein
MVALLSVTTIVGSRQLTTVMSMLATPLRGGKFGVTMLVGLVGYDGINIMTSINFRV